MLCGYAGDKNAGNYKFYNFFSVYILALLVAGLALTLWIPGQILFVSTNLYFNVIVGGQLTTCSN